MITSFFEPKRKTNENSGEVPGHAKRLKINKPVTNKVDEHVEDLMSSLTEDSWKDALATHVSKSSFSSLAAFVAKERKNGTIYPPTPDTFTALNLVPMHKVKVVIVGQDPCK